MAANADQSEMSASAGFDEHAAEHALAKDSLHILPLSNMPLLTPGLRRARLVKNSRLEGVVELFADAQAGSGQVAPEDLTRVFHFDSENKSDLTLVRNLSELSSYDVYSLRVELRRLGIEVDNLDDLRLSEDKVREVAPHMTAFTRPLVKSVFGKEDSKDRSLKEIVQLFASPDRDSARQNLVKLSDNMGIEVSAIPAFLQNYGDVYLSLAYYQSCLNASLPKLKAFLKALAELKANRNLAQDRTVMAACNEVEQKLSAVTVEVSDILDMFRARTESMWEEMSEGSFQRMEQMIADYQSRVGGALCVATVKMDAWAERFPRPNVGGPTMRADFVMNTMRPGLDRVQSIQYHDQP